MALLKEITGVHQLILSSLSVYVCCEIFDPAILFFLVRFETLRSCVLCTWLVVVAMLRLWRRRRTVSCGLGETAAMESWGG